MQRDKTTKNGLQNDYKVLQNNNKQTQNNHKKQQPSDAKWSEGISIRRDFVADMQRFIVHMHNMKCTESLEIRLHRYKIIFKG